MDKQHPRILVVDDEESIRKVLTTILEEEGYVVDTVGTAKEAIQKANTEFYNLALIDIRLPDMEGTELLTRIENTTPKMVRIIITGYPSLQNAIEAVNRGADAYVMKPFNVKDVLNAIEKHLINQRLEREYSEEKVAEFIMTRARQLEAKRR